MLGPKSVLDIGIGYGRWGILSREFLDISGARYFRDLWRTRIDGIEIFPKYIESYHSFFYNNIYIGDAFQVIDQLEFSYDLIILGDVLEHFEKPKALEFLNKCMLTGKAVLLIIPIGTNWEQGQAYGNEFETHLSFWEESELDIFPTYSKAIFKDEASREFATYLFKGKD
jgi:SAM-dependent methyltransferase